MDTEKKPDRPAFAGKIESLENESNVVEELKKLTTDELIQYILYLRSARAFKREDRLKLQILDNVDFTIWACDRDLNVKLWEGSCEKVYSIPKSEAISKNYLSLIVDPLERHQSKEDTLAIIDTGEPQHFRLCDDADGRGFPIQVITQCCRIEDDEEILLHDGTTNRYLQAEMAINMNYNNLLHESKQFIKVQNDFKAEVAKARKECLDVLEKCKNRILEAADERINQYYHICVEGKTYSTALKAIENIIDCRSNFLLEYQEELQRIKKEECFCDLTSDSYSTNEYTFANKHSFNCVFRHNRKEIIEWRAGIERKEIQYQMSLASIQLSDPAEKN